MSALIIGTFAVRVLFGFFLAMGLLCYVFEFGDDQGLDFGSKASIWYKHIANENVKYPGHRGDFLYILIFLFLLLFHLLGFVGIFFEHIILLCIVLPCHFATVIVDFIFVGYAWMNLGYWSGLSTIILGNLATIAGIVFIFLLYLRGPSTIAAVFADDDDDDGDSGSQPPTHGRPKKSSKSTKGPKYWAAKSLPAGKAAKNNIKGKVPLPKPMAK